MALLSAEHNLISTTAEAETSEPASSNARFQETREFRYFTLSVSHDRLAGLINREIDQIRQCLSGQLESERTYLYLQYIVILTENVSAQLALAECYKNLGNASLNFAQKMILHYLKERASLQMHHFINEKIINNAMQESTKSYITVCNQREFATDLVLQALKGKLDLYDRMAKESFENLRSFFRTLYSLANLLFRVDAVLRQSISRHQALFEIKLFIFYNSAIQ